MREMQLDRWMKELVRASVEALPTALERQIEDGLLLWEIAQRLREVLVSDRPDCATDGGSVAGLGEELAMAVYLTIASSQNGIPVTPHLLPDLNLSLTRTVERLCSAAVASHTEHTEEVPS